MSGELIIPAMLHSVTAKIPCGMSWSGIQVEGDVLIGAVSQHLRLICGKLMAVRSLQLDE